MLLVLSLFALSTLIWIMVLSVMDRGRPTRPA